MYAIRSPYWIICDSGDDRIDRLRFHIEQGDYFPFLATIVSILGDTAARCESDPTQALFAEDLREDLLYVHEHYEIRPREKPLEFTREKSMRFPADEKISTGEKQA